MKPVRSLLDCVDQCMAERLCHGSFYIAPQRSDLTGNCMILDNTHTLQEENCRWNLNFAISLMVNSLYLNYAYHQIFPEYLNASL